MQILCADSFDPLLPRPFSFLTVSKKDFSILYQVVGKGTKILSQIAAGDALWIVGPLGNGFTIKDSRQKTVDRRQEKQKTNSSVAVLIGGGVGIPPLYHLVQDFLRLKIFLKENIHVFLGARHKSLLLCEKDFKRLGINLKVATDDGSKGRKGFVTELLEDLLRNDGSLNFGIFTCGPTPMLKAVSIISEKYEVPCEVSVEVPMACGFGACLGCAIKVAGNDKNEHRFAIACCEGPVFQAKDILWD